jgi:DNA-binding transcriptional LysR family regulator
MARPNLVNLETVLWIAKLGTFTAAAQKLCTTQPAISARVRELESALGVALFERMDRGVRLTVQGRAFVATLEPLLGQIQDALVSVEGSGAACGVVRIGIRDSAVPWFGRVLSGLQSAMPRVTYELQILMTGDLQRKVLEGTLDAAIIAGGTDDPKLECNSLGFSPMLWVMSPLRQRMHQEATDSESLKRLLNGGPIWLVPRTSKGFQPQIKELRDHGARLDNINTCDSMSILIEMVMSGSGIGYLPAVMINHELEQKRLIPVSPLLEPKDVYFYMISDRERPNTIVQHIVDIMIEKTGFFQDAEQPA